MSESSNRAFLRRLTSAEWGAPRGCDGLPCNSGDKASLPDKPEAASSRVDDDDGGGFTRRKAPSVLDLMEEGPWWLPVADPGV